MGGEFGQGTEWNHEKELEWYVLQYPLHQGLMKLIADLNKLYCSHDELHGFDFEESGFEWIDCHDASQSIISYQRKFANNSLIVILNFTPMPRENYRIGVPNEGNYREIFNSDSEYYSGSNVGNGNPLTTDAIPWMNHQVSLSLTLPPLGAIVLQKENS